MDNLKFEDFHYHALTPEDEEAVVGDAFKIIFLGDISVGKTNLMTRFTADTFSINSKATIGCDVATKPVKIGQSLFRLQIWDTSGQERYKSFTAAYFKDANGIIFVYDITNRSSFTGIEGWHKMAMEGTNWPNVAKMLIGNKSDCQDTREVSEAEGEDFAKRIGVPFFETSAMDNHNDCVGRAFFSLVMSTLTRHHLHQTPKRPHLRPGGPQERGQR